MKRGAEKQLTKDDGEEIDDNEDQGQGFKKAAESTIAARVIKPLPSRGGRQSASLPSFGTSTTPNPLSFGPGSSSGTDPAIAPLIQSTSFFSGFTPKTSAAENSSNSTSPSVSLPKPAFSFNSTSGTSTHTSSAFSITPQSNTSPPAASSTSKAFASLLNTSSTNIFGGSPSSPLPSTAIPATVTSNGTDDLSLTNYYTNLRALNSSLLSTLSKAVENDPFSDLVGFLESYKTMRSKVQKEHEASSEKSTPKPEFPVSSKPTMPTPSSFPGFAPFKPPSSASSAPESKPPAPVSVFSPSVNPFAPKDSSSSTSSGTTNPAPPISSNLFSGSSTPSSGFSFGPSSSTSTYGSTASGSTSSFTFGPAKTTSSTDKAPSLSFGVPTSQLSTGSSNTFGSTTSASTTDKPVKMSFGGSSSQPSSATSNPFGPPATNIFGSSTSSFKFEHSGSSNSVFGNATDTTKKPETTINFGSPSPAAKSSGIFFGFGSAPAVSTTTSGESSNQSDITKQEESSRGTSAVEGETASKEATPGLLSANPHDEEGEGEENEEALHAIKVKAYRMKKADEKGGAGWAELGLGVMRLKKDKDTGARRVLMRNSTNGKININFKIYSSLKPSLSKKALTFVGHDNGISQTYCVRLPNEGQATELKDALDREIEFVRAKEGSE